MSTFRFRLATLLRLREAARDEKRARLAEAYRAAEILAAQLQEIDGELAAYRLAAQQNAQRGIVDVDQLLHGHRYERVLTAQKNALKTQQKQVAEEIDRRRLALVEADRQVRVLEKLREKKQTEHATAEERRDQRLMDELASRARPAMTEVTPCSASSSAAFPAPSSTPAWPPSSRRRAPSWSSRRKAISRARRFFNAWPRSTA
jgi:flagellar FliJ protein